MDLSLGIDFGTSGARAIAIAPHGPIQATVQQSFAGRRQTPEVWQAALWALLQEIPQSVRSQIGAIAINGTSSTVLLCDGAGQPLTDPLLYNDDRGRSELDRLKSVAPPDQVVLSATSSLAKLLWWEHQMEATPQPRYLLHQADWLSFLLHGQLGVSDYHNALKLGYDVGDLRYPDWLVALTLSTQLPRVVAPGTVIGRVKTAIAQPFGLSADCVVCAGTTDSIAAFLASGAQTPGEAVTSLGSTLVLKLLSQTRVDAAQYGVYSHRLGDLWLVGGASNTGGAVLQQFFSNQELVDLSRQINPAQASSLDYYPLVKPGERFPVNDPTLEPCLTPRPENPAEFLHGLLESMARIEAQAYRLLQDLGASTLTQVYTAGGGAQNSAWTQLRSRYLQVSVQPSQQTEAAYGTAQLASQGLRW